MTATFSPRKTMLRVDQKNFPAWALFDAGLDSPGLLTLYVVIWYATYMGWEPTQADLATMGKMGLRTVQDNLKLLEQRGFLVARRENGRKFYDLALSPHVLSEFLRQGVEFQAVEKTEEVEIRSSARVRTRGSCAPDTRNPRATHAKSAHPFKNIKEIKDMKNTPLSPLPHGLAPGDTTGSCLSTERGSGESFSPLASFPPSDASFHSGRDQAKRAASGRPSRPECDSVDADFARLWAAWPVHQGELPARNIFRSLARRGRLPSIQVLLDTVSRFRAEDCGWKQGARYVPRLDYWLRDERWTDEPRTSGTASAVTAFATPIRVAPAESPEACVQVRASRETMLQERARHIPPLSVTTARELARISPAFRRIADKLRLTEAADDQTRTGTDRIPGLSGRDAGHAAQGLDAHHDPFGTEQARQNLHDVQTVVAIPDGTGGRQGNQIAPSFPGAFHADFFAGHSPTGGRSRTDQNPVMPAGGLQRSERRAPFGYAGPTVHAVSF